MNVETFRLPAGSIIHLEGMPYRLVEGALVEGRLENLASTGHAPAEPPAARPDESITVHGYRFPADLAARPEPPEKK